MEAKLERERKRQELERKLREVKEIKPKTKPTPKEIKWKNIDQNFTAELIKDWESKRFTYEKTKEWIDIGLSMNDADYCAWIRDIKKKTPEWVLNNADEDELNQEYETWKATK